MESSYTYLTTEESYWSGRPDDCSFRPPTDPSVRD